MTTLRAVLEWEPSGSWIFLGAFLARNPPCDRIDLSSMCGIAAIIGPDTKPLARAVAAMTACMAHRGPNDEGVEVFRLSSDQSNPAGVVFGHRRLSILDLSPLGHQPMIHPQTGDAIIFNGEIYNFQEIRAELEALGTRFLGHSDTEVLLHALSRWGEAAIAKLAGMYAFAFLDRKHSRLLLARDPMGIKPLYTAKTPRGFVLASEVRTILASGLVEREPDPRGVATLLAYGAVQEPYTFFKGIDCFPAGHWQWLKLAPNGSISEGPSEKYWRFPKVNESMTEAYAVERLQSELSRSVREHLISDVPVGVFLSSGIDSTVMAGLARECSASVRTFTLGFLEQPDLSESQMALASAREMGVEHHDIQVTAQAALDLTRTWINSLDQPSVDGLNTYIISKSVRDAGIVVAISGLGGDELFGGYPSFGDVPRFLRFFERTAALPKGLRTFALRLAAMRQPAAVRDKVLEMGEIGPDVLRLYLHRRRTKSNTRLRSHGFDAAKLGLDPSYIDQGVAREAVELAGKDTFAAVSRFESMFYMRSMLLRDSDATSMQHSLEIRVPFLDRRVLDFAYTVPGRIMLPSNVPDKHLLRVAFGRFLRRELLAQAKRGFVLPIRRWMQSSLKPLCLDSLASLKASGLMEPREVEQVWKNFEAAPEARTWSSAFLLSVLGNYLHEVGRIDAPKLQEAPVRVS